MKRVLHIINREGQPSRSRQLRCSKCGLPLYAFRKQGSRYVEYPQDYMIRIDGAGDENIPCNQVANPHADNPFEEVSNV